MEKAVASLSEHRRYLELLSDAPVEEQARQVVDMSTMTEDGRAAWASGCSGLAATVDGQPGEREDGPQQHDAKTQVPDLRESCGDRAAGTGRG